MAWDDGIAEVLRDDLAFAGAIAEKRMFGALCFLLDGNMVACAHAGGAMFRVGPALDEALAMEGTDRVRMGERTMGGFVEADADLVADDDRRGALMALALAHARSLPPK